MYYGDKREAKVNIMAELVNRGWKVFGYSPDQSDSMTDYYHPSSWDGIAEKNGYVLVIDNNSTSYSGHEVKEYNYNKSAYTANDRIKKLTAMMNDAASTENEKASCAVLIEKEEEKAGVKPTYAIKEIYPTFQHGNPKSCSFHVEKDGQIVAKGTGVFACYVCNDHYEPNKSERISKVNAFVDRVETAIKQDGALESEVIKVPITVIKPVEIDTKELKKEQVNDDTYFIMKVGYTGGIRKGTMFKCERASTIENSDSFIFAKLGKNLKPSKARGKTWYQSITDLNNKLSKGHIAIVEMQEFIEWESKTVYKKTAKKQKANFDNAAITGEVQDAPEVTEEITVNETELNNEATLNINNDKNGIEIKFNKKPSANVITALKEIGFRWSSYTSVWWVKQTEERLKFATMFVETFNDIAQEEPETNEPETVTEAQEATQEEETIEVLTAYEYGVKAFNNGIGCAPALDSKFLEAHIKGLKVGEGAAELMEEWLNGWTRANLDTPIDFNNNHITEQPKDTYAFNIDPAFNYHDIHFKAWNMDITTLEEYLTVFEIPYFISGDKFICKGLTTEHVKMVEEINIVNKAIIFYDNKYNDNSNNSQQAEEPQTEEQKEIITEPIIINGKITVKEITFEWSESSMIKDNLTVSTFAEAEELVRLIASNVRGGYDKTKFIITWTDGDTYTGRLDVEKEDANKNTPIKDHITDWLLFLTGDKKPSHMTVKTYHNTLKAYEVTEENKKGYYEFFEKYALTDMEPNDYSSETTNEPTDNVTNFQEYKNNITGSENDLTDNFVNMFDDIKIENTSRIAPDDQTFCEEQERMFSEAITILEKTLIAMQDISSNYKKEDGYKDGYIDDYKDISHIKSRIEEVKKRFTQKICYYFEKKYQITIEKSEIFAKKFENKKLEITYQNVLDEIFIQLGGFTFKEKAVKEIKEAMINLTKSYHNDKSITNVKNNKVIFENLYLTRYDDIWKEYRFDSYGENKNKLFKALSHFDHNSTEIHWKFDNYYHSKNEKNESVIFAKNEINLNKVKYVKLLKNGKVEVEFDSYQSALQFAKDYCNHSENSSKTA